MKHMVRFQGTICCRLTLFFLLAVLTGCVAESKRVNQELARVSDPQLSSILLKNIHASGGMTAWLKTQQIEAQVLATILDRDGGKTFLEQTHLLIPRYPLSMTVTSKTPEGFWMEKLIGEKDQVKMALQGESEPVGVLAKWLRYPAILGRKKVDEGVVDVAVLQGAGLKLRLFSQALTGSLGLLREDWQLSYGGQERKGGRLTYKIIVNGPILARELPEEDRVETGDQLVVWIDAESFLFDRIWLRYRVDSDSHTEPFVYLAANIKGYQKQADGLMLPSYIGLVHSDRHQQFSETEILRIETLKFLVTQKKKKRLLKDQ